MAQDPEDVARDLVDGLDRQAFAEEVEDEGREGTLEEAFRSFHVMFNENQQGVQHELLERAFRDERRSEYGEVTAERVEEIAVEYARDAMKEFATLLLDDDVTYAEVKGEDVSFDGEIVDAVMER